MCTLFSDKYVRLELDGSVCHSAGSSFAAKYCKCYLLHHVVYL